MTAERCIFSPGSNLVEPGNSVTQLARCAWYDMAYTARREVCRERSWPLSLRPLRMSATQRGSNGDLWAEGIALASPRKPFRKPSLLAGDPHLARDQVQAFAVGAYFGEQVAGLLDGDAVLAGEVGGGVAFAGGEGHPPGFCVIFAAILHCCSPRLWAAVGCRRA